MLDELALARGESPDLIERRYTPDQIRLFLFWHVKRKERDLKRMGEVFRAALGFGGG